MTTTPDSEAVRRTLAHDRLLSDWLEAEAMVTGLRRSVAAAAASAAERARDAEGLARSGRRDAFALGVADAARLLAQRAETERRRLEGALREEARLRAQVADARQACAPVAEPGERRSCA